MSSILKALKKVERERGGRPSPDRSPLSREILDDSFRPEMSRRSRSPLPLVVLTLLALGGLAGVLLMRSPSPPPTAALPVSRPTPPVAAVVPPPAPVTVAPIPDPHAASVPEPETQPAPASIAGVPAAPPVESPSVAKTPPLAPPPVAPVAIVEAKPPVETPPPAPVASKEPPAPTPPPPVPVTQVATVPVPATPPSAPPVVAASPPVPRATSKPVSVASRVPGWALNPSSAVPVPVLKVSEIHYRPAAQERLAVVNDLPVLEGVDIEGARVDRIFKDRIRFVVNGRFLEVKLDSGAAP